VCPVGRSDGHNACKAANCQGTGSGKGGLEPHGLFSPQDPESDPLSRYSRYTASSRHFGSALTALAGSKRPRQGTTGHDALNVRTRDPDALIGATATRVATALFEKGPASAQDWVSSGGAEVLA